MDWKSGNLVLDLSFKFSLDIIAYTEVLAQQKKYEMVKQLFNSGTSVGANCREAQSAESRKDFIHKIKIASKEAEETEYWLLLCKYSESYPDPGKLLEDIVSLKKVTGKIIGTSKGRIN
jgi:four helix bundle protein